MSRLTGIVVWGGWAVSSPVGVLFGCVMGGNGFGVRNVSVFDA